MLKFYIFLVETTRKHPYVTALCAMPIGVVIIIASDVFAGLFLELDAIVVEGIFWSTLLIIAVSWAVPMDRKYREYKKQRDKENDTKILSDDV